MWAGDNTLRFKAMLETTQLVALATHVQWSFLDPILLFPALSGSVWDGIIYADSKFAGYEYKIHWPADYM